MPFNAFRPVDLVSCGCAGYGCQVATYVRGGQLIKAPRWGTVMGNEDVDDAWLGGRF